MLHLQLLKLLKFSGVLLFVGGAVAAFVARDGAARRAAVHRLGSIGLLLAWGAGYALATTLHWRIREPWLAGAFATTAAAHVALAWSVADDARRTTRAAAVVAALIAATLALMIFRPTWGGAR